MLADGPETGDELYQSVNHPHRDLPSLLEALVRAFANRTQLVDARLRVDRVGTLVLGRAGRETTTDWLNDICPSEAPPGQEGTSGPGSGSEASVDDAVRQAQWRSAPNYSEVQPKPAEARRGSDQAVSLVLPLSYASLPLGEVRVSLRGDARQRSQVAEAVADFARQCGLLIKRHEVQQWAARRLGQPTLLVGLSAPARALDRFVEKASANALPVLIRGEFGTEKAQLAAMIHGCGARRDGPLVQVNGAEPTGDPASWFDQAEGGTLFFSDIDDMTPSLQRQLPQYMTSRLGQWLGTPVRDLRVIASTTADLGRRVVEGRFSQALLAELDFLSVIVPPLRERTGDIEALVAASLQRHGYRPRDKASAALIGLCQAHSWPENTLELERVVARLAAMTAGQPIGRDDVRRHAPQLVPEQADPATTAAVADAPAARARLAIPDRWVRCAVTRDADAMKSLHDGLKRALLYLGDHFADPVSLNELAEHANISASHLSFLFRTVLGSSFKTLLTHIRVQRAKEMLAEDARLPITEVAMCAGFFDLSHFEKSFRRIVGCSPRDFRRSRLASAVEARRFHDFA